MGDVQLLKLTIEPATPKRWADLEKLFGPRGACAGCWCMFWRLARRDYEAIRGDGARAAMRGIVQSREVPGLLAYADGEPIGWCAVAPRKAYSALERSRILKRVDDQAVWSIVCFFVARRFRRQGVMQQLLRAAVAYAASQGARIVEGYPIEPKTEKTPDVFAYTGFAVAFREAGFVEVARRSETRPIMRYVVREG